MSAAKPASSSVRFHHAPFNFEQQPPPIYRPAYRLHPTFGCTLVPLSQKTARTGLDAGSQNSSTMISLFNH
jgi:hypothetical protein